LSKDEIKIVVMQAGEILAKIHSITPQKYGKLYEGGVGGHESWKSYMLRPTRLQQVKGLLESAKRAGIPKEQIDLALQILGNHTAVYQDVTPHLLHGDYGPKHILIEDGHITGILDFENSKSGDPIHDFAWWSYFGKNRPPIEWLKEGYEKTRKLPDNFELKLRLGRLRLGMDMIRYFEHEGHELGLEAARVNLKEDLDYFQSKQQQ
jgi:aminoglycoside phosphotransferase (APT) family kinase protein